MAKTQNPIVGASSGKMANVVFSRSYGSNLLRSMALVVKNPRTDNQLKQRSFFKTIEGIVFAYLIFFQTAFSNHSVKRSAIASALAKMLKAPKLLSGSFINYPDFDGFKLGNGNLPAPRINLTSASFPRSTISGRIYLPVDKYGEYIRGELYVLLVALKGYVFDNSIGIDVPYFSICEYNKKTISQSGSYTSYSFNGNAPYANDSQYYVFAFQVDSSYGVNNNAKTKVDILAVPRT